MFCVGIAFTWWREKKKPLMLAVVGIIFAFMYGGYVVGRSDGEDAYFARFRTEMNPFLRDLRVVSAARRDAAIRDFLIRADDGKLMSEDYLKDLKGARLVLAKEPNQPPEPTR